MHTKHNKITLITLGCSKNLVDSENIITHLANSGYDITHERGGKDTDTVIINTCGFIHDAKQESINTILQFANLKRSGEIKHLYVTGCLSQRYRDALRKEIPEVDDFTGTNINELLSKFNIDYKKSLLGERLISTPPHYAYLKIAEGCDRHCSFCAIPLIRGKHRSRSIDDIVTEAQHLADKGVKELILISQELTYYGLDMYGKRMLPALLDELVKIDGPEWIRLHYTYPGKFPMELIDTMAKHEKICNYLDIPLQHANDRILKSMKRFSSKKDAVTIIEYARKTIPDIAIRTTFIVGYPGETQSEYEELLDFVKEMQFDRVGVFEYSHEEDTAAFELEDSISEEEKKYRAAHLMEIQSDISYEKNLEKTGQTLKVLIDKKEDGYYTGRTQYDSPEVDNEVVIHATKPLNPGEFYNVKITDAEEYDLHAKVEY